MSLFSNRLLTAASPLDHCYLTATAKKERFLVKILKFDTFCSCASSEKFSKRSARPKQLLSNTGARAEILKNDMFYFSTRGLPHTHHFRLQR